MHWTIYSDFNSQNKLLREKMIKVFNYMFMRIFYNIFEIIERMSSCNQYYGKNIENDVLKV